MAKKRSKKDGENVAGYFRQVFKEQPHLLHETSNQKLLDRWLADHPGETAVPKTVKANLANLKSVLRSQQRQQAADTAEQARPKGQAGGAVATVPTGGRPLEALEHQIDECLILAKHLDRDGLESVIAHLRRARNEVVWKLGQ